jgi:hypothetical protein
MHAEIKNKQKPTRTELKRIFFFIFPHFSAKCNCTETTYNKYVE